MFPSKLSNLIMQAILLPTTYYKDYLRYKNRSFPLYFVYKEHNYKQRYTLSNTQKYNIHV